MEIQPGQNRAGMMQGVGILFCQLRNLFSGDMVVNGGDSFVFAD